MKSVEGKNNLEQIYRHIERNSGEWSKREQEKEKTKLND